MFKRLKFLLKRPNKRYKSKIKNTSVNDIEFVDTSNYSDTLYNIVCSINNIPCDINSRTLNYDKMIEYIINNNYPIEFTNSIYIIYFKNIDFRLLEFINILNEYNTIYNLEKDKIVLSNNAKDLNRICNTDLDNEYLNILRSNITFNFDMRLDDDILDSQNIDMYHENFVKNNKTMLLPLIEDDKYHIYVLENQLLNFNNTNLSKGFDYSKVSLKSIKKCFIIIICFDNFNTIDLEILCTDCIILNDDKRIICKFTLKDIENAIEYFSVNLLSSEEQVLYNFFKNTYLDTISEIQKEIDNNIQMMNFIPSETEFVDGLDEIL